MEARRSAAAATLLEALRPRHWIKNLVVLAPWVFAGKLPDPVAAARARAAFGVFCALSSGVYLANDVADREEDRAHPRKRHRPVASGRVSVPAALLASALLFAAGLSGATAIGGSFAAAAAAYVALNLAYSIGLKRIVIVDVMAVAAGFLIRAWSGALALSVEVSRWLVLCSALLALLLGFVKRRQEMATLAAASSAQRPVLRDYSLPLLDQRIAVVTASTVLAYALYAFSPEVGQKLGTGPMGLTLPFVLFGIFRYLYLVHQRGEGDNPTAVLLGDLPLLLTVALWGAAAVVAIYIWR